MKRNALLMVLILGLVALGTVQGCKSDGGTRGDAARVDTPASPDRADQSGSTGAERDSCAHHGGGAAGGGQMPDSCPMGGGGMHGGGQMPDSCPMGSGGMHGDGTGSGGMGGGGMGGGMGGGHGH